MRGAGAAGGLRTDGYYDDRGRPVTPGRHARPQPGLLPGAPVCDAVVDDQVVWRDDHHLTARYAVARRDQAWHILKDALPGTDQR